jgi:hypothetical protein
LIFKMNRKKKRERVKLTVDGGGHTGNSARFWGGDEAWH